MSRIIVADICSISDASQSTGHYFAVAQNYMDMFSQSTVVRVAGGPIYSKKFSADVITLPYNHILGETKVQEKWHELMNCRELCKNVKPDDIVVLQSIALVTAFIGILLFMHTPCRLFIIQYNTDCLGSTLKRFLWKIVSPKVQGIIGTFSSVAQAYRKPFIIVPDYIYTPKQSLVCRTYEMRKYDVCMLGHIYHDKGVVEALQQLKGKGLKIIVAGKIGEPELEPKIKELAHADNNIELRVGYLPESEYHALLEESKYCMLNYHGRYNEHSSGVVYDALFHRTPILASDTASTKMVKEYGLGITFTDVRDVDYDKLFNTSVFADYQHRIDSYLLQQQATIDKLSTFLQKTGRDK